VAQLNVSKFRLSLTTSDYTDITADFTPVKTQDQYLLVFVIPEQNLVGIAVVLAAMLSSC